MINRALIDRVAPPGSRTRATLKLGRDVARDSVHYARRLQTSWVLTRAPVPGDLSYRSWLAANRVDAETLARQAARSASGSIQVDVSVIVLASGADPEHVVATLKSLEHQTFRDWSATVVGTVPPRRDARVHGGTLEGAQRDGDPDALLIVLEAGDVAEPDLLFRVASSAWDDPSLDVVHWDDDEFDAAGKLAAPRFRPSWSPDTLLSANYLGRSFAIRRRVVLAVGGLKIDAGDECWWELLLRADLTEDRVARVPRVLSHLRRRLEVTPERGADVVRRHLDRLGRRADVSVEKGSVRVRWIVDEPHVTVIIPTRHNREMLGECLPSLAATAYPSFDVMIVDNGERTGANERWYREQVGLDLEVEWWDQPFNYSAVNNRAAEHARGDILVFLNDDTVLTDPGWLSELVGWVRQPDVGLVGVQLIGRDGLIQHGGIVIGMHGLADHLFAGMEVGSDSLMGPTAWYRNTLSVTGACVAIETELFRDIGGFDERMVLCGSDVVLGLDARLRGRRSICTPYAGVMHLESATRGTAVPRGDFFASYWRYQRWLRAGDPYYSPSLSLRATYPALRAAEEPDAMSTIAGVLGRDFTVFRQKADEAESIWLSSICRADAGLRSRVETAHHLHREPFAVRTVNWFVPDIDSPFYGGINTALRIADHLARHHQVENRFVVMAAPNEEFFRSALAAAFPALADATITFWDGGSHLDAVPPADVAIATLWVTAYGVAHLTNATRRFYLIQDFEPMFYPAGTNYALAEESYRLGLYGLCNTERLADLYRTQYAGAGWGFMPAVDDTVFHARGRAPLDHDGPVRVFVYARPGHWRNCWELASLALAEVKKQLGERIHIVTAGSWARPDDLGTGIEHLGLLEYAETGDLYRTCDVGVALTVSAHPSYLPLELMACGVPVVAFDNPAGDWILHHEQNSLRCPRTVDGLRDALIELAVDGALRERLSANARADIARNHADWSTALSGIYGYLCDPHSVL